MEIYGRDIIIGNFRASNYQCYLASFSSDGDREEDTGIEINTSEEFIGDKSVPVYIGQSYSGKLHPHAVLTKDSCVTTNEYFDEHECRAIIRLIIGQRGYQWMKIITDDIGEDIWYKVRVNSIGYQKLNGRVVGIILDMECDSQFAWSTENTIIINAKANTPFYIFNNSDDLYNYLKPYVEIIPRSNGNLEITNKSDNNWTVRLNNVRSGETITYDCEKEIIDGSRNLSNQAITKFLDDSNCRFFRLLPEKNIYISNLTAKFTFKFRTPRKVGFVAI